MAQIPALELNQKYQTEGIFYQRELNGEQFICRSLAKIQRRGEGTDKADAIFVMVNPGSCQPKNNSYVYTKLTKVMSTIPLVEAKSDKTQEQIMRIMERQGWNTTYIVNLSDLRAGNIADFKTQQGKFEAQQDDSHSIFSDKRIPELKNHFAGNTIIIVGWGTQTFMKEKMKDALNVLAEQGDISGLPHKTHPYYYHPFPLVQHKCIKYIDDLCELLDGNE